MIPLSKLPSYGRREELSPRREMRGLARWLSSKEPTSQQCRRLRFCLQVGKIPERREGLTLQYSCLENPMDRVAWRAIVHGVVKSLTRLSTHAVILTILRIQIHEHKMLFHLLTYPLISFTDVLKQFSLYKSYTCTVHLHFYVKVFSFFHVIINCFHRFISGLSIASLGKDNWFLICNFMQNI